MSEARPKPVVATGDSLQVIASSAWALGPPTPHERRHVLRSEAGILLDGLLVRCARGRGALDVAIGAGLAALSVGDRAMDLGFSGIGDYARERLGIAVSTAQKMARLATALGERPKLREAVERRCQRAEGGDCGAGRARRRGGGLGRSGPFRDRAGVAEGGRARRGS